MLRKFVCRKRQEGETTVSHCHSVVKSAGHSVVSPKEHCHSVVKSAVSPRLPALTPAFLRSMPLIWLEEENSLYESILFKMLRQSATPHPWVVEWFYVEDTVRGRDFMYSILQPLIDQGFKIVVEHNSAQNNFMVTISWDLEETQSDIEDAPAFQGQS